MPFGLCNAPATFERLMDQVLGGLKWENCLVYLDDVIIHGRTFDEHIHRLERGCEEAESRQVLNYLPRSANCSSDK